MFRRINISLLAVLLFMLCSTPLAQQDTLRTPRPFSTIDTSAVQEVDTVDAPGPFVYDADSLSITDSLALADQPLLADSLEDEEEGIDSVVHASSRDSLVFFVKDKKLNLYGKGELNHKETTLTGGEIFIDFETSDVIAKGVPSDTVEGMLDDRPVLLENGSEYTGNSMTYNFKTTRGYITYAATEGNEANYSGTRIKKVDQSTFFIEDGFYTTCDADHPHYGFYCMKMKVIPNEQVIGEWIWLTFGGVPFPVPLPFGVFPLQTGRRSGLIPPTFGEDQRFGTYFKRFGYFWAINDYMDLTLTSDYYTRGGFGFNTRYRYNKRYDFNGNVEASYRQQYENAEGDPDRSETEEWRLRLVHSQQLSPTARFDANLDFQSNNFFEETSTDYNQLLRDNIYSKATYYKNFDWGANVSVGYSRNQELQSGDISEVLPSVSFSKSQFYPFRGSGSALDQSWYEQIGFNYKAQLENRRQTVDEQLDVRGALRHTIRTSASPKIGFINISPSLNYVERWYVKRVKKEIGISPFTGDDTLLVNDVDDFNAVRTFDMNLSASTKIYGIFETRTLGIEAVRHIISPRITYTYQPDFSEDQWGYYDSYTDISGNDVRYNKFEDELYSSIPASERQFLNFSVDNVFEMKTMEDPTDTTSQQEKIQLLNLSASVGYDVTADSLNFTDIRMNYRTSVGRWLNLYGSSTWSLYDWDENGREQNTFLADAGKGLARLKNFSLSLSTSLSGDTFKSQSNGGEDDELPGDDETIFLASDRDLYGDMYGDVYGDREADFDIPWSVSLNYNYNFSQTTPDKSFKSSTLGGNFNFNITRNWKFTVSGSYDFVNDEFSAPRLNVSRDLHCWIMNFTWNPIGTYTGYRFEIRVKAPQLQDLKLEKSDSFFTGRR